MKWPGVLSKVQMLNLVFGVGVFSPLPMINFKVGQQSCFSGSEKGVFWKGSSQKSRFSRDSREFRDSRDSREPPDCGKQRRIRPSSRDSRDSRESRESRDSSSEKTPFVITPFSVPEFCAQKRHSFREPAHPLQTSQDLPARNAKKVSKMPPHALPTPKSLQKVSGGAKNQRASSGGWDGWW